jgi:hypothetical protein
MLLHTTQIILGLAALTLPAFGLPRKRLTTALAANEFDAFKPASQFARAAYCPTDKIMKWQCGEACDALPGFQPTLNGGDGNGVQFFFVGYYPKDNSVVVAHEGTDPTKLLSLLTDIDFIPSSLDQARFPGAPADVKVHKGFRDAHYDTALPVLNETKRLIAEKGADKVLLIGHSLGGAIAEMDTLMMRLNLPENIAVKGITFGTPRLGSPEFAQFFNSKITDFSRINHDHDPIPTVPGRFLGFQHPGGEIHIVDDGPIVRCSGLDNGDDKDCSDLAVPNIIFSNILDHLGPYGPDGVHMGTIFCT